ncbi:MAG TPA: hypothetical protein GXZ84_02335 [Bacteroidales bacterium]|nr:hypothetical protein [Bacteroidales bacterium]
MDHYFEPYKKNGNAAIAGIPLGESLAGKVSFYKGQSDWFKDTSFSVVLIGAGEARNSADNKDCGSAPDLIRKYLYSLAAPAGCPMIGDAGNLRGSSLNDRYLALEEAVAWFIEHGKSVIVLGGSQDLSLPMTKGLISGSGNKSINLSVGDAMLDIDTEDDDFSSRTWLGYLISEFDKAIEDVTVFGIQSYLTAVSQLDFLSSRFYEYVRLGDIRGENLHRVEPLIRDANVLSLDYRMMRYQPQFGNDLISSHGIEPFEMCRILRYAGLCHNVRITGIFEMPVGDSGDNNAMLAGQLVWHFLDGFAGRAADQPDEASGTYRKYVVPVEAFDEQLYFCRNTSNDRWWVKSPAPDNKWISCGREDYRAALRSELPPRWWRMFVKHSTITKEDKKNNPTPDKKCNL